MFSLFKSKPKLKELIPNNYVDIHSHILPGIDDGAKTITDSQFLMESMIDFGFERIITTPHTIKNVWDNSRALILQTKDALIKELPSVTQKVSLACASEYFMDENFVKLFQEEPLLTLKDHYVLVEMSYLNAPIQLYEILFELQLKGYQPVLAHPERYTFFHNNFKEYDKLKKAGCLFQMNLLSSVGFYGKDVALIANKLLDKNMIDYVGSDIHHKFHTEAFSGKVLISNLEELNKAIERNRFFS